MKARIEMPAGSLLRVAGPLKARVVEGLVLVLGAVFKQGEEFQVSEYRSYGLKALDDSTIEFMASPGSSIEKPLPGEEVVEEWVSIADSLIAKKCTKIVVLGPTDAGKSSLVALIANRALLYGETTGIIDSDIGQSDIGPPATVSAAILEKPVLWLRELKPLFLRFVGSITPQKVERKIVSSIVDLAWRLKNKGATAIIVDTDGWIQGLQSLEYKLEAARLIEADALIVVGGDEHLAETARSWFRKARCGVRQAPTPRVKRTRDRDSRRDLRSQRYRAFLEKSYTRSLWVKGLSIQGSCFFSGKPLGEEYIKHLSKRTRGRVIAASETSDTVYIVVSELLEPRTVEELGRELGKQVYLLDKRLVRGALVGVIGETGVEESIGVVEDIDFEKEVIKIRTPYTGEIIGIVFGHIRLNENYSEEGRPVRCIV